MIGKVAFGKVVLRSIRGRFQSEFVVRRGVCGEFVVVYSAVHDIQRVLVVRVVYGYRIVHARIFDKVGITIGISQNCRRVGGQFSRVLDHVIGVEVLRSFCRQSVFRQPDQHIGTVISQYHMLFGGQSFDGYDVQIPYLYGYGNSDFFGRSACRQGRVQRSGGFEAVCQICRSVVTVHADSAFVDIPSQLIEDIPSGEGIIAAVRVFGIIQGKYLIPLFGQQFDIFFLVEVHRIDFGHDVREIVRSQHYGTLYRDGYRNDVKVCKVTANVSGNFLAFAGYKADHSEIPINVNALRIVGVAVAEVYLCAVGQYLVQALNGISAGCGVEVTSDTVESRLVCPSAAYRRKVQTVVRIVEYDLIGRCHRNGIHSRSSGTRGVVQFGEVLRRTQAYSVIGNIQFHEPVVLCGDDIHGLCVRGDSQFRSALRLGGVSFAVIILYRNAVFVQRIAADVTVGAVAFVTVVSGFGHVGHDPGNIAVQEVLVVEVSVYVADIGLTDQLPGRYALFVGQVLIVADYYVGVGNIGSDPFLYHGFDRRILVVQR